MEPVQARYLEFPVSSIDEERDQLLAEKVSQGLLSARRDRRVAVHFTFLYTAIAVLVIALFLTGYQLQEAVNRGCEDRSLQDVYSPANSAVEYEVIDFEGRFNAKGPYMGIPNNETDRLWEELYDYGVSMISKEEAAKLHENTARVLRGDGYVMTLDVFHQLHCLDDLRKALYPERYSNWKWNEDGTADRSTMEWDHWDHCIDALRQTLICHGDVTPLTVGLAATHQCRKFKKIQDWARHRRAPGVGGVE